jgi:hypothetical protein
MSRAGQLAICRKADGGIIAHGCDGFQRHVAGALDGPFALSPRVTAMRAAAAPVSLSAMPDVMQKKSCEGIEPVNLGNASRHR